MHGSTHLRAVKETDGIAKGLEAFVAVQYLSVRAPIHALSVTELPSNFPARFSQKDRFILDPSTSARRFGLRKTVVTVGFPKLMHACVNEVF